MADHLPVSRFASSQLALGLGKLRTAELEAGFGLSDIGPGKVADLEAVARRLEVGLEHPHIVLLSSTIARSRITSM